MYDEIYINTSTKKGWIEVITGSMFSGKTEELIRRLKRAKLANQKVKIFKHALDNRFSMNELVTHDDNSIPSISVSKAKEILAPMLTTYHKPFFMEELIRGARRAIRRGRFDAFKREFLSRYAERRAADGRTGERKVRPEER